MATLTGIQIRIKLLDIKGKVKPELTDELAADLGFEM